MLAAICHKLLWTNRLVTMVHGLVGKAVGFKARCSMSAGAIVVAINTKKFTAISIQIGLSLKLW